MQPFEHHRAIDSFVRRRIGGDRLELIEADDVRGPRSEVTLDECRRHVMGDPVCPRSQRTAFVEPGETPPQREMNLLPQIVTLVTVSLIRANQPRQGVPKLADRLVVQGALTCLGRNGSGSHSV